MLLPIMQRTRRAAGAFFLLTLTGCATLPPAPASEALQIANVPAFAQAELQCGPAALASVLSASGVPSTPESLTPDLFIPARKGSLQVELVAQARLRGRVPLLLAPTEQALIAALREGQPALLLLNQGVRSYPIWHYAALTGFDPVRGYTLNNGKAEPQTLPRGTVLRQWHWAERWALTLHRPTEIPAYAEASQWIAAAAPLQRSHAVLAEQAYRAAVQRWPDAALAWAALGEARFAAGDMAESVSSLRKAAALAPQDAAIANNLASVELARGCVTAARRVLDAVAADTAPAAVAQALRTTRQEVDAAGADRCVAD